MGVYKKNSLIERISNGSDLSDAMLIALKRCNQKIQDWISGLPNQVHCLLCGILQKKNELFFYAEETPEFKYDEASGSVKANRFVFALCTKCAEQLHKEDDVIDNWDSRPILDWQIDFLVERGSDVSVVKSRGEMKRRIIEQTSDSCQEN